MSTLAPAAGGEAPPLPLTVTTRSNRVVRKPVDLYVEPNKKAIARVVRKDRKKDLLGELTDWKALYGAAPEHASLYWVPLTDKDSFETVSHEHDRIAAALGIPLEPDASDTDSDGDDDGDKEYSAGDSQDDGSDGGSDADSDEDADDDGEDEEESSAADDDDEEEGEDADEDDEDDDDDEDGDDAAAVAGGDDDDDETASEGGAGVKRRRL